MMNSTDYQLTTTTGHYVTYTGDSMWIYPQTCWRCGCTPCMCPTYVSSQWIVSSPQEPASCIGKAHVFECEHVESCKCGSIRRVMPKAKPTKVAKAKRR